MSNHYFRGTVNLSIIYTVITNTLSLFFLENKDYYGSF